MASFHAPTTPHRTYTRATDDQPPPAARPSSVLSMQGRVHCGRRLARAPSHHNPSGGHRDEGGALYLHPGVLERDPRGHLRRKCDEQPVRVLFPINTPLGSCSLSSGRMRLGFICCSTYLACAKGREGGKRGPVVPLVRHVLRACKTSSAALTGAFSRPRQCCVVLVRAKTTLRAPKHVSVKITRYVVNIAALTSPPIPSLFFRPRHGRERAEENERRGDGRGPRRPTARPPGQGRRVDDRLRQALVHGAPPGRQRQRHGGGERRPPGGCVPGQYRRVERRLWRRLATWLWVCGWRTAEGRRGGDGDEGGDGGWGREVMRHGGGVSTSLIFPPRTHDLNGEFLDEWVWS